jgi:hypothetical protein
MATPILPSPAVSTQDDPSFVTLASLADELGMDRSHLRKYLKKSNIDTFMVRTIESKGQPTLAVTPANADYIKVKRVMDGFITSDSMGSIIESSADEYFYLLLLVPELSKSRIKVGYASDLTGRIAAHRTTCPTLEVIKAWRCKKTWEVPLIDLVANDCKRIGQEVFDCDDTDELTARIDAFFDLMPSLN